MAFGALRLPCFTVRDNFAYGSMVDNIAFVIIGVMLVVAETQSALIATAACVTGLVTWCSGARYVCRLALSRAVYDMFIAVVIASSERRLSKCAQNVDQRTRFVLPANASIQALKKDVADVHERRYRANLQSFMGNPLEIDLVIADWWCPGFSVFWRYGLQLIVIIVFLCVPFFLLLVGDVMLYQIIVAIGEGLIVAVILFTVLQNLGCDPRAPDCRRSPPLAVRGRSWLFLNACVGMQHLIGSNDYKTLLKHTKYETIHPI
jgi:hypothetical protein